MSIGPHTQGWATTLTSPVAGDPANQAHLDMQEKARDIGERFAVEHDLNVSTTSDGRHAAGSARAGFGATATRPPQRFTLAQDGPSQAATGGNERGRFFYDETRFSLQVSTAIGVLEVWQDCGVPQGAIVMWSGSIAGIPQGWLLCDGTSGTPNLSGRFIVGYNAGDADYSTIGNTGGSKTYDNIAHTHTYEADQGRYAAGNGSEFFTRSFDNTTTPGGQGGSSIGALASSSSGAGTGNNRPPYFTLAYIQKA